MPRESSFSRRAFLRLSAVASFGLMLFGKVTSAFAVPPPAGMPAVPETDPIAQGLGYKQDTKDVDKKKFPMFKPDRTCKNCMFYTAINNDWGKCQMLVNGAVTAKGWCASWSKKA